MTNSATAAAPLPRQIPYIIATEGCERFGFYGMRNILTPFLVSMLLLHLPVGERGLAEPRRAAQWQNRFQCTQQSPILFPIAPRRQWEGLEAIGQLVVALNGAERFGRAHGHQGDLQLIAEPTQQVEESPLLESRAG